MKNMNNYKVGNNEHDFVSSSVPFYQLQEDDTIYACFRYTTYGGDVKKIHNISSSLIAVECESWMIYLESDDREGLYVVVTDVDDPNNIECKFHANKTIIKGDSYIPAGKLRNTIRDLF